MKRLLVIIIVGLICFNVLPISSASNENELSMEDFYFNVDNLILNYEDSKLSSEGSQIVYANRLIVKTKTNTKLENYYDACEVVEGYDGLHILQFLDEVDTTYAYNKLLQDDILYVEYDYYLKLQETPSVEETVTLKKHFSWNSSSVQVDEAFAYLETNKINCQEITVAVIDSGLHSEHKDLKDFVESEIICDSGFKNKTNIINESGDKETIYQSSMQDDLYHGTAVLSVVLDNTMANIIIKPYRVTNDYTVNYIKLFEAFDFAVSKGDDVINMSLGGGIPSNSKTLYDKISAAINNGVIVVASAGNDSRDTIGVFPGCHNAVITVAATDQDNKVALEFSNFGKSVDVSAPGVNINCPSPRAESDLGMGGPCEAYDAYMSCTGTSYAAPLVAALAATLKSINPDATSASIERIIKQSAYVPEDWEENCNGNNYGTGIVNFYNAVQLALKDKTEIVINSDKKFEITPVGWSDSLYYTLDGSEPTPENGIPYTEPLDLSKKAITVIKAASFMGDAQVGETTVYRMTSFKDMKINRGETEKAVSDSYSGKIRWWSDNFAVATVDSEGNVTGVSEGNATVVATLESGKRIIFNVTVKEQPLYWLIELFEFWLSLFGINI